MATLTAVAPAREANELTMVAAAAGGDEFVNDGKKLLVVKNADVDALTVTITTQMTVDGEDVADKTVSVPAGETHLVGPFPPNVYNDGDGKVQIGYDDETDVTVGVIDASAV